jgi:hypothetical protein
MRILGDDRAPDAPRRKRPLLATKMPPPVAALMRARRRWRDKGETPLRFAAWIVLILKWSLAPRASSKIACSLARIA